MAANCLRELIQSRRVWLLSNDMTPEKFFFLFSEERGLLLSWLKDCFISYMFRFRTMSFCGFFLLNLSLCQRVADLGRGEEKCSMEGLSVSGSGLSSHCAETFSSVHVGLRHFKTLRATCSYLHSQSRAINV